MRVIQFVLWLLVNFVRLVVVNKCVLFAELLVDFEILGAAVVADNPGVAGDRVTLLNDNLGRLFVRYFISRVSLFSAKHLQYHRARVREPKCCAPRLHGQPCSAWQCRP